eukprot:1020832-Rhodomonas_salina.1
MPSPGAGGPDKVYDYPMQQLSGDAASVPDAVFYCDKVVSRACLMTSSRSAAVLQPFASVAPTLPIASIQAVLGAGVEVRCSADSARANTAQSSFGGGALGVLLSGGSAYAAQKNRVTLSSNFSTSILLPNSTVGSRSASVGFSRSAHAERKSGRRYDGRDVFLSTPSVGQTHQIQCDLFRPARISLSACRNDGPALPFCAATIAASADCALLVSATARFDDV